MGGLALGVASAVVAATTAGPLDLVKRVKVVVRGFVAIPKRLLLPRFEGGPVLGGGMWSVVGPAAAAVVGGRCRSKANERPWPSRVVMVVVS